MKMSPDSHKEDLENNVGPYHQSLLNNDSPHQKIVNSIKSNGYPIQVFSNVETKDKYILTLYRIPHGVTNQKNSNQKKPVVLLMHGFLASAWDYLLMGPGRGLAYILADRGYDVWLGNYRGSELALKHKELDAEVNKEYWNFSFHEIGVYDLPAMIDFIKHTAECKKLSYIGTSQGTTSMFVLLSEKPQYNKIIKVFICLAPVCNITNMESPLIHYLAVHPIIWKPLAVNLGWFSFPTKPLIKLTKYIADNYCHPNGVVQNLIVQIMFYVFGQSGGLDEKEVPLIVNHILNATAVKHYIHFSQNANVDEFRQFDYGTKGNIQAYGQATPPHYDLSKITCPVALFHSHGDWISGQKDLDNFKHKLSNVVVDHLIDRPKFNHMDFSLSTDVADALYKHVAKVLEEYNRND